MFDLKNTHYFAGFFDGEGNFALSRDQRRNSYRIAVKITQRLDSEFILKQLQKAFGGSLNIRIPEDNANPQNTLTISSRESSLRLISYFDEFPLVGKAAEYKVWREAVLFYYQHSSGPGYGENSQWLMDKMKPFADELKRLRQYDAPSKPALENECQQKELSFS